MKSLLTQLKAHKIISALAVVVIIIIAIVAGSGSKQTPPANSKTTASKPSTAVPSPHTQYTVTEDKTTNVGVLVPASDDNATTMKQLGETLENAYSSRSHVLVFVFDNQDAANLLDTVLAGNDTTAQDVVYDPHFVAEYERNAPTNLSRFVIQFNGGISDPNPTQINY
jgi:hypothetical protein